MKFLGLLAIVLVVLGALTIAMAGVLVPFAMFRFMLAYLGMGGLSFIGILKGLVTAIRVVFFTLMGLGRMLLANPLILAITLLATAVYLIYQNWTPIKAFFSDIWNSIVGSASRGIENVINTMSGWWTYLKSLPSQMLTIGGQIIDGLWNGISAKWEALKTKVAEIGNSISTTIKDKLGIKSPSRVFAEIGLHTMTGLQQGLSDNQNAPLSTVMGLSKQLKHAATGVMLGATISTATATPLDTRPPLATRAASTGSSNSYTYQITINATAGMDEKKLADLVMQKIKEAERQKQSARRSSLIDTD
jgi:phage-related protein